MKVKASAEVRAARRATILNGKPRRGRPPGRRNGAATRAESTGVGATGESDGAAADVKIAPRVGDAKAAGVCAGCSAPYSDGEEFCAACGANLRGNMCDGCDEPLKPGAAFCPTCGMKRDAATATIPADEESAPAKLSAPPPSAPPPTLEVGAPMAPTRRPLFTKFFVSMAWVSIAVQTKTLLGDDFRALDPAEIDMLVDATQEVLDRRANIGGENADLWRLAIVGGVVFVPRIFVVWVKAKREHARQLAADAELEVRRHADPSGPPVRVIRERDGARTVDGGAAPGSFAPPPVGA